MDIKKILIATSLITTLLIPNLALAGVTQTTKITGTVDSQIIASYDNVDLKDITTLVNMGKLDKNLKVLVSSNNSVNITRIYPAKQGMVFVNGKEVIVNSDGQYSADITDSSAIVEFKINSKSLQSKEVVTGNSKSLNVNLVDSIPFSSLIESMDEPSTQTSDAKSAVITPNSTTGGQKDGEPVYYGDWVHCNRFNGPNSDHHYWTWIHPTAFIDFSGSDCDWEMFGYGCPLPPLTDNLCDGLDVQGNGHNDCSDLGGFHWFAWFR